MFLHTCYVLGILWGTLCCQFPWLGKLKLILKSQSWDMNPVLVRQPGVRDRSWASHSSVEPRLCHLPATWPELWGMKLTYIKYSEWSQVHVHFMEVLLLFLNRKHSFILISSRSLIFYFLNFFLYCFYPWKIKLTTLKKDFLFEANWSLCKQKHSTTPKFCLLHKPGCSRDLIFSLT